MNEETRKMDVDYNKWLLFCEEIRQSIQPSPYRITIDDIINNPVLADFAKKTKLNYRVEPKQLGSYKEYALLVECEPIGNVSLKDCSFCVRIASNKSINGTISSKREFVNGELRYRFYDFYAIERLGFYERLCHFGRKIFTAIFRDSYVKVILASPV